MTAKEYEQFRETFLHQTLQLSDEKRIEYTEGNQNSNVLWNFESIGKKLGLEPMQVLSVYLNKHLSSLQSYFKDGQEHSSESIEGRVSDIINYLLLFLAMKQTYETKKGIQDDPEC
jgi:tryptophan 2,3-dioxygenase|tara:strand:+ start:359 stop:706 length:348 start_codon:yes stop_codon:yes gene_type:complete